MKEFTRRFVIPEPMSQRLFYRILDSDMRRNSSKLGRNRRGRVWLDWWEDKPHAKGTEIILHFKVGILSPKRFRQKRFFDLNKTLKMLTEASVKT